MASYVGRGVTGINQSGEGESEIPFGWILGDVLDEDLLQKVNAAMGMFFWIGWHARGATEESDHMLRMME